MKAKLQSFFRHALTGAATVGTFLGTHGLIDQADVAQTNADAAQAVPLIASVAAAVVSRILLLLVAKYAPRLGSLLGSQSSGTGVSLLAMGVTAAVLCSALPSCGLPDANIPVTGSIFYRDPKSGAKGGLAFTPGERPTAYVRVPVYDPETGEKRGEANLSIPVGKTVPAVDADSGK